MFCWLHLCDHSFWVWNSHGKLTSRIILWYWQLHLVAIFRLESIFMIHMQAVVVWSCYLDINYVFLALDSTTNKVNLLGSQLSIRPFILLNRSGCLCCGYEIIPGCPYRTTNEYLSIVIPSTIDTYSSAFTMLVWYNYKLYLLKFRHHLWCLWICQS